MRQQWLRSAVGASLIFVVAVAVGLVSTRPPSPLAAAERLFQALAFHFIAPATTDEPTVVIAGISEDTLDRFPYRSPIDRAFLVRAIDQLAASGARAIGVDVVVDRPTEPEKDAALHRAVTRAVPPVVLISVAADTSMSADRRQFLADFLNGVRSGYANLARDRFDDVVRDHNPADPAAGTRSFPAAIVRALGYPVPDRPFPIRWNPGKAGGSAPIYPIETIALLPPEWLRGKVVLIGAVVPGTDEHRTLASSFGSAAFGVEIHAQVVAQMLAGHALPAPAVPWAELCLTAGLALVGLAVGAVWFGYTAVMALMAVAFGFIAAILAVCGTGGPLLPAIGPIIALATAGGGMRAWRGRAEHRDRLALQALFSRFVSADVVKEIMRERDLFMAGGRPRPQELTATVLYADVASFTTICEGMAPEPLIAWLDCYIDAMAAVIMAHDGVLLRFIGDGILAVFGVPIPRRDEAAIARDARNAAACALAMEQAMDRLNDAWHTAGLPEGGLRVGLHTGPLIAGSLGTGPRMEFCLLGDTANVGARLEQLGKDHAEPGPRYCTIVVGGPTWSRLAGAFPGKPIGEVQLRGKQQVLMAYRIDSAAARWAAGQRAAALAEQPAAASGQSGMGMAGADAGRTQAPGVPA
jgi:adenylate cyclase